jgi:hypothetical protein
MFGRSDSRHQPHVAFQDLPIEKKKRMQGLILRRSAHRTNRREVIEKSSDLLFAHRRRMTAIVK